MLRDIPPTPEQMLHTLVMIAFRRAVPTRHLWETA